MASSNAEARGLRWLDTALDFEDEDRLRKPPESSALHGGLDKESCVEPRHSKCQADDSLVWEALNTSREPL